MSYSTFDLSTEGGVAHLKLNRPQAMNSMNKEFWKELPDAVTKLHRDGAVRVLLISSTGPHFSAGMDLSVFEDVSNLATSTPLQRDALRQLILLLQETFSCLQTAHFPVIAAVQGACIGGALDMVAACDIRYCTVDATFRIHEINLAMMADLGSLQRLPRLLPVGIVRELAFTGEPLSAARAKQCGLVNEVYDDHESLLSAVLQVAKKIAAQSPLAIAASKQAINYAIDHPVEDSLKQCATLQASVFSLEELSECMQAKREKRKPAFSDLMPVRTEL